MCSSPASPPRRRRFDKLSRSMQYLLRRQNLLLPDAQKKPSSPLKGGGLPVIKRLLLLLIRFYRRFISPMPRLALLPVYADLLDLRDAGRSSGTARSTAAIWPSGGCPRCQAFYKGSFYEPVPPKRSRKSKKTDKKVVYPPAGKAVRPSGQAEDDCAPQGGRSVHAFSQFAAAHAHRTRCTRSSTITH